MVAKQVVFKEMELLKEGVAKGTGVPWQKYQYYGDDGEHYVLFGKLELEKPYQLIQKTREYNGKTYTDWAVLPEAANRGAGVTKILEKMDVLLSETREVKQLVEKILSKTPGIDPDSLPF